MDRCKIGLFVQARLTIIAKQRAKAKTQRLDSHAPRQPTAVTNQDSSQQASKDEGVIKYQLDFTLAPPLPAHDIAEINHWRAMLYTHKLVGQDPALYGGYGY